MMIREYIYIYIDIFFHAFQTLKKYFNKSPITYALVWEIKISKINLNCHYSITIFFYVFYMVITFK